MQDLDTILGFLAILLVASLVITAGTQAAIALLGLRGANLRLALANLFESACQDRDARRYSKVIARRVLQQPLVSGSIFSRTGRDLQGLPFLPADAAGKLRWAGSGIPMQPWILGAAGGFVGLPVALWTINRLISWDSCTVADSVARYVPFLNLCEHPWRSGAILGAICGGLLSRSRLATSIRLDELVDVLERLSAPAGGTLPDPAQRAMLVVAGENRSRLRPKAAAAMSKPMHSLTDRIDKLLDDAADELGGGVAVAVEKPITQVAAHAEARAEGLTFWFDRGMERASQRFTMQARVITVILSGLLVFGAHLDAIRLFQSLSTDAQMRAQLAASAEAMTRLAEQFSRGKETGGFQLGKEGVRSPVPEVYRTAMASVLELPPALIEPVKAKSRHLSRGGAAPASDVSVSSATSVGAASEVQIVAGTKSRAVAKEREKTLAPGEDRATLEAKLKASKALAETAGFASREDALLWLRETLNGSPALESLATAYEQELNAALPSDADKLVDHSASIKAELNRSKPQLVPGTWRGWAPTGDELPGLLIAVAFLSLGATICFNLLKRIASLRPLPSVK